MRILVQMPNWLGDAVMATPALNNLLDHFRGSEFVMVGSPVVADLFADDLRFQRVVIDKSKKERWRLWALLKVAVKLRREHGPFDFSYTFQNSLTSRIMLAAVGAPIRVSRKKHRLKDWLLTHSVRVEARQHHALIHNSVLNGYLGTSYAAGKTTLPAATKYVYPRPTVGLHAGAAYGSAKRWEPARFAEAAARLSNRYDIILFGAPHEKELIDGIEADLHSRGVTNVSNVAGKTTVRELVALIGGLALFIANDSGPMHVAGALNVPTVAVFGSTDPNATRPWNADRSLVLRRDLACSPCHERHCPLGHHACMNELTADMVVAAGESLLSQKLIAIAG